MNVRMWFFENNPWGKQGSKQGGARSDHADWVAQFFLKARKFYKKNLNSPDGKNFSIGPLVLGGGLLIGLVYLMSGVYTVKEGEQAVVVRLGSYHATVGAGLRYHLPYPFEKVFVRNVAVNNYLSNEGRERGSSYREQNDFYMLTGDENLVEVDKYTIHWRIKDLKMFLFNVRSQEAVISATADSVLREVIAKTPINLIITERRAKVNEEVSALLQERLDFYKAGVHIVEFIVQRADPPEPVMEAFIDVTRAEADRERAQHEARGYRDEILPKARAVARKTILEAEAYAEQIIAKSEGEAGRFRFVSQEFSKAPNATSVRLYIEAMENVLSGAQKIVVDPKTKFPMQSYFPLPVLNKDGQNSKLQGSSHDKS